MPSLPKFLKRHKTSKKAPKAEPLHHDECKEGLGNSHTHAQEPSHPNNNVPSAKSYTEPPHHDNVKVQEDLQPENTLTQESPRATSGGIDKLEDRPGKIPEEKSSRPQPSPDNEMLRLALEKKYTVHDNQSRYTAGATHNEAYGHGSVIGPSASNQDSKWSPRYVSTTGLTPYSSADVQEDTLKELTHLQTPTDCLTHLIDTYVTKEADIHKYLKQTMKTFPAYAAASEDLAGYKALYGLGADGQTVGNTPNGSEPATRKPTLKEVRDTRLKRFDTIKHPTDEASPPVGQIVYSPTASGGASGQRIHR
ncbi:hypothetical protein NMY22_g18320 [Coprinellus aureogranulatus]|nr:hypothetical protein NMY22_g18320 [Coprinellus aureogranulatus]